MKGLLDRIKFTFQVNYHSNGQWLLYAEGWQIATPTADDPIYYAMSGNLDKPAIEGFHPGLSSDVLYVTNGETTDYAHASTGALAWTPELSAGCDGLRVRLPGRPRAGAGGVRAEPAVRAVRGGLGGRPGRPEVGARPDDQAVLPGERRPLQGRDPRHPADVHRTPTATHSRWPSSPSGASAPSRRSGRSTAAPVQSAPTPEWTGERYTPARRLLPPGPRRGHRHETGRHGRGLVRGRRPTQPVVHLPDGLGDRQQGPRRGGRGLHGRLAGADDPARTTRDYYLNALKANGIDADVYDVDARGRTAPDQLGVLSHYDAAVWYPGDDIVTRKRGGPRQRRPARPGRDARVPRLPQRGRPGALHRRPGRASSTPAPAARHPAVRPEGRDRLQPAAGGDRPATVPALRGSGDNVNDVLQYWFGAYIGSPATASTRTARRSTCSGSTTRSPVSRGASTVTAEREQPGRHPSYVATSGILPPDEFKQFESWPSARWDKPGGPFAPHTGDQYVYSQIADVTYKRLTRTITVPAGWRHDVVLDVLRHRGRLGLPLRRGPHRRPGRLDDAAGRQRSHVHRRPGTAAPRAGTTCIRGWTTTRR